MLYKLKNIIIEEFQNFGFKQLSNGGKLEKWCQLNPFFRRENDLNYVTNYKHRISVTKLRLSCHKLQI